MGTDWYDEFNEMHDRIEQARELTREIQERNGPGCTCYAVAINPASDNWRLETVDDFNCPVCYTEEEDRYISWQ